MLAVLISITAVTEWQSISQLKLLSQQVCDRCWQLYLHHSSHWMTIWFCILHRQCIITCTDLWLNHIKYYNVNSMVIDGKGRLICLCPKTSQWPWTLHTWPLEPHQFVGSTCVSFDTNPFSGSAAAITFTRFPRSSLPDLDTWPHDLENVTVAVDLVVSNCDKFVKIYVYTFGRQVRKCLSKCLFDHTWFGVTVTFDLLTSKSNQFIFVPNCTYVANLAEFLQALCNKQF